MFKDSLNAVNDSLKVVSDSLSSASDMISNITFNPSNVVQNDGIFISVVGYVVVFIALLLLYLFFSSITRILISRQRKRVTAEGGKTDLTKDQLSPSGEINAAIGLALYLHFADIHDFENTILTIKKVQKTYSPWSSKIYGLREYPRRK